MNMSFAMTTKQIEDEIKFVTRRLGWWNLKPGQIVEAVKKCQGLKKGERITWLKTIKIEDVRSEPLNAITQEDVILEGFPEWTPKRFVDFFCKIHKCQPDIKVNRIQFSYVKDKTASVFSEGFKEALTKPKQMTLMYLESSHHVENNL